jgi:hypothetical protein
VLRGTGRGYVLVEYDELLQDEASGERLKEWFPLGGTPRAPQPPRGKEAGGHTVQSAKMEVPPRVRPLPDPALTQAGAGGYAPTSPGQRIDVLVEDGYWEASYLGALPGGRVQYTLEWFPQLGPQENEAERVRRGVHWSPEGGWVTMDEHAEAEGEREGGGKGKGDKAAQQKKGTRRARPVAQVAAAQNERPAAAAAAAAVKKEETPAAEGEEEQAAAAAAPEATEEPKTAEKKKPRKRAPKAAAGEGAAAAEEAVELPPMPPVEELRALLPELAEGPRLLRDVVAVSRRRRSLNIGPVETISFGKML